MDLDYRWYTLTVEIDGPDGTRRELGVIRGQLPTELTGTDRLAGIAVMLDAAAENSTQKRVTLTYPFPPEWTCPAVKHHASATIAPIDRLAR